MDSAHDAGGKTMKEIVGCLALGFITFFFGHWVGYESALKPINKITYAIKLGEQTISVINPDGTVICSQGLTEK